VWLLRLVQGEPRAELQGAVSGLLQGGWEVSDVAQIRYNGVLDAQTEAQLRAIRRSTGSHGHIEIRDPHGRKMGRFPVSLITVERDEEGDLPLIVAECSVVAVVHQQPRPVTSDATLARIRAEGQSNNRTRPNAARDAEIYRRVVVAGEKQDAVAADYGVSASRVCDIVKRMR